MRQSKNKMRFLAIEICELKKFQMQDKAEKDIRGLSDTIAIMEKQFWFKYNNLK